MSGRGEVPPGWEPALADLERRRRDARAMGGADKIARQHAAGRLTARQRVERLVDEGSFVELGGLVGSAAGVPADGFVAGSGRVDGRDVLAGAEDFTVMGGSIGIRAHAKRHRLAELALQERVPLVMMLDGAGERAQNAFERYPRSPNDLQAIAQLSGLVPTVAMILGPSAGHSAVVAPLMDFVVMTEGASAFAAGPPLVREATGEVATKEELGGAYVHAAASGLAHAVARDDEAAIALVRRYLGFFPQSAWARPPRDGDGADEGAGAGAGAGAAGRPRRASRFADTGERSLDDILDLVPADHRRAYDMRRVLALLADAGDVLELQPAYGGALLTALARLGGEPVAIVASQPLVLAGSIDGPAADKAARFIELADAFHLPVVFLADTPGILVGRAAERDGILRRAMRMFAAQSRIRGVKIHVTLRKVYGVASCLMGMNPFDRQTVSLALPIGRLGAMPASGAGDAAKADADLQAQLAASELGGVYGPADSGSYDDVIDPRELRNRLLHALRLARHRVETTPAEPARRTGVAP